MKKYWILSCWHLNVSSYYSHLSQDVHALTSSIFFFFFFTFFFFQKEAIQNKIKLDNAKAITAAKPPVVLVQPVTESVFLTELS